MLARLKNTPPGTARLTTPCALRGGSAAPTEAELARQEGRDYEPASVLLERIKAERAAAFSGGNRRRSRGAHV